MKKLNSVYESSFSKFRISVQNSLVVEDRVTMVEEMRMWIKECVDRKPDKERGKMWKQRERERVRERERERKDEG